MWPKAWGDLEARGGRSEPLGVRPVSALQKERDIITRRSACRAAIRREPVSSPRMPVRPTKASSSEIACQLWASFASRTSLGKYARRFRRRVSRPSASWKTSPAMHSSSCCSLAFNHVCAAMGRIGSKPSWPIAQVRRSWISTMSRPGGPSRAAARRSRLRVRNGSSIPRSWAEGARRARDASARRPTDDPRRSGTGAILAPSDGPWRSRRRTRALRSRGRSTRRRSAGAGRTRAGSGGPRAGRSAGRARGRMVDRGSSAEHTGGGVSRRSGVARWEYDSLLWRRCILQALFRARRRSRPTCRSGRGA